MPRTKCTSLNCCVGEIADSSIASPGHRRKHERISERYGAFYFVLYGLFFLAYGLIVSPTEKMHACVLGFVRA